MYKKRFNYCPPVVFRHFSRKGYALFSCLGKEVIIGTLSVSTLTFAKANSISVTGMISQDSISHEELRLDEVIVTGSRAPLTELQSARIVAVITRSDIERSAAESVNDLLKTAIGVDVRQRGGFGVQTDISINGGTFDQITILLNGMNISSPQTGHNAADFPVSLSDIERIEVLEGASARVFGSSSFSGAVNIVTRQAEANSVKASAQGGSFGTFGGDAGLTLTTANTGHLVSGGYTQSDGGTLHSDFKRRKAYYKGHLTATRLKLDWQAGFSSQDFGANTFYSAKFNNQYEETRRLLASVNAEYAIPQTTIRVRPALYGHRDYDHYQLVWNMTGAANGENYHRTDVLGASVDAYGSWLLGTTAVGVDVRKEKIWSTALGTLLPEDDWKEISGSDRRYDHKGERTNTSVFAEHDIIAGGLTVSLGMLANRNTGLDNKFRFYPGIDVSYRPDDHWKIFLSWNKSLRVPTYTDLYTSNSVQVGDVNLKPEKNSTYKGGVRYRRTAMEATANVFYSNGTDMIDWVYETQESTKYHALNIGKLDNMGAGVDLAFHPAELWHNSIITRMKLGYAYIHQKHETEAQIFKSLYALEYLRHKLTAEMDHRIVSRLSAHWTFRWQQRMNGFHPYAKLDAKLLWSAKGYELFVKADNLTSHRYYDLGGVLQPGIWVMAGGSIRLNL